TPSPSLCRCALVVLSFQCYGHHRHLRSFPTRRSSDLVSMAPSTPPRLEIASNSFSTASSTRSVSSSMMNEPWFGFSFFATPWPRSEEHTSELQSRENLVCRLLLEKKKQQAERVQHDQQ